MQYHLAQIEAFCDAHPIDAKALIVPTMTVGHDLAIALVATGYSWLNLQIETPRSLAEKDAGSRLIEEGHARMAQDADLFWLDEMIPQAVREVNDDYFAQQAAALTRPFLRTLRVLRAAGLEPDSLSGKGTRHRVLRRLYQTYCATYERDNLYDNAVLYQRALNHLKTHPPPQNTYYAILDETPLPRLAFEYLCEKTKGYIRRIGRENMGVSPPPHSAAKRFPKALYPANTGKIGVGGNISKSRLFPKDKSQIQLCETLGTETEISTVLRDIRSGSIPLDTVEIAYTSEMPYVSLLCDAVQRFDLPATYAEGIPVSTTRTGRALVNFYRWVGAGYPSDELVMMCRAGLIASEGAPVIATVLQHAHIGEGEGPRRYFTALNQIKADLRDRDAENSETGHRGLTPGEIETVEEELNRLFALIPRGPNVSLNALVNAGLQFLAHFVNAEEEVLTAIQDRLHHVAQSVRRKAPVRRLANRLSELIANLSFKAEAAKPGHLAIASLSTRGIHQSRTYLHRGHGRSHLPRRCNRRPNTIRWRALGRIR